jgi:uncharacterized membrane protein YkoI
MKTHIKLLAILFFAALYGCTENKTKNSETIDTEIETKNKEIITPEAVILSFQNRYQNAADIAWEMESENKWEAEFTLDSLEYTAVFDSKGTWLETEKQISYDEVTPAAKAVILREIPNFEVDKVEIREKTGDWVYELQMVFKGVVREVVITPEGSIQKNKIVKRAEENDKNGDEEDNDDDDE